MGVECSILVCSYRPIWSKLKLTVNSILMQRNCSFRIVVADDGSEINLFHKLREYLHNQNFYNYELVSSPFNQGTVSNIQKGLSACNGEYVKFLSPGDFFHGEYALRDWIDYMNEHKECSMTFCDAIYYRMKNGKVIATREYVHPQWGEDFSEGTPLLEYILYGDTCLGAATMLRLVECIKYINIIAGKVIYTEDVIYRIMLYCGLKIAHIKHALILYEYGTGISTCNDKRWGELIRKDFLVSDDIMLSLEPCDKAKKLCIVDYLKSDRNTVWKNRWQRLKFSPMFLLYCIKIKMLPKMTTVKMNDNFIHQVMMLD